MQLSLQKIETRSVGSYQKALHRRYCNSEALHYTDENVMLRKKEDKIDGSRLIYKKHN